jgi:hypothetical protein
MSRFTKNISSEILHKQFLVFICKSDSLEKIIFSVSSQNISFLSMTTCFPCEATSINWGVNLSSVTFELELFEVCRS